MAVAAAPPVAAGAAAPPPALGDTVGWVLRMVLLSWSVSTFMNMALKSMMPDPASLPRGADSAAYAENDDADSAVAAPAASPRKGDVFAVANQHSLIEGHFVIRGDGNTSRPPLVLPPHLVLGSFEAVELWQDLNLTTCALLNCSLELVYTIRVDRKWDYQGTVPLVFFQEPFVKKKRRLFGNGEDAEKAYKTTEAPQIEGALLDAATRSASPEGSAAAATATATPSVAGTDALAVVAADEETALAVTDGGKWKAVLQQRATFSVVNDFRPMSEIPPQLHSMISQTPDGRFYKPIVYVDNFWTMPSKRLPFNTSLESPASANVTVEFRPSSFWRTLMFTQWDLQMDAMGKGEAESMKKIFVETNPVLLAVTVVVSLLHLVFEYLAFSNDISFWKNTKDYKGLSLKTIALNCYFQTIIFLYLLDGDLTSYTVLGPAGIGVLIEYWKLRKTMTFERIPRATSIFTRYKIHFSSSYDSKTRRYDEDAMRYLFMAMVPCMLGYTVYSLYYEEHKGWYSFTIATQVRFIYLFGFVMMTPQIFVNYKMKSVTQLPWRTFVYKALNTFIDDLFAFIITMPTMHRLACFRDDIIFFILLYQRWIYKVDPHRTQSGVKVDGEEEEQAPAAIADAPAGTTEAVPAAGAGEAKVNAAAASDKTPVTAATAASAVAAAPQEAGQKQQQEPEASVDSQREKAAAEPPALAAVVAPSSARKRKGGKKEA